MLAHDVLVARSLPQEAAGVVIALCAKGGSMHDDFGPIWQNLLACANELSEIPAAVFALEAPEGLEALVAHDVLIVRSLPLEMERRHE